MVKKIIITVESVDEAIKKLNNIKIKPNITYDICGLPKEDIEILYRSNTTASHIINKGKSAIDKNLDYAKKLYRLFYLRNKDFPEAHATLLFTEASTQINLF